MPDDRTPTPGPPADRAPADRARADHAPAEGSGDDRFALVLDRWRDLYGPEQWPVSLVARRLEEVRRAGQHDGANPALLPTARFGGQRIADVEVLNARTGESESAGIYRLWRRDDG